MQGKLDPAVGCEEELKRTTRRKNTPLLVGGSDVAKTAKILFSISETGFQGTLGLHRTSLGVPREIVE